MTVCEQGLEQDPASEADDMLYVSMPPRSPDTCRTRPVAEKRLEIVRRRGQTEIQSRSIVLRFNHVAFPHTIPHILTSDLLA